MSIDELVAWEITLYRVTYNAAVNSFYRPGSNFNSSVHLVNSDNRAPRILASQLC